MSGLWLTAQFLLAVLVAPLFAAWLVAKALGLLGVTVSVDDRLLAIWMLVWAYLVIEGAFDLLWGLA